MYKLCPNCGGSGKMKSLYKGERQVTCGTCGGAGKVIDHSQKPQARKSVGSGGGGNSCFPGGTMISTPSGRRDIASIEPDDYVISLDVEAGQFTARRVLTVRRHSARKIWRLSFENEHQVRTTSVHSFHVNDGWKKASRICQDDRVLFYEPQGETQWRTVTESSPTAEVEDVFNLIVEEHFNFVADGALAHSFSYFRGARVLTWRILTPYFSPNRGVLGSAPA
jgi:hypothetical protein